MFAFILCFSVVDIHADDGGYTIDDYTVNAIYHSNNTIDVKEVIDVNFSSYRHGIYRNIPETMYINRDEKYKLQIKDIQVLNDEYDVDSDSGNRVIQIGSEDYTVIGPHTYTLTYTIVIPEDYHSDLDFIYYSVLGNNWDTTISHFSFDIQFEKALTDEEISNIQVFSGSLGNQSNDLNVTPIITSTSIRGSAYDICGCQTNHFQDSIYLFRFSCFIWPIQFDSCSSFKESAYYTDCEFLSTKRYGSSYGWNDCR